MYITKAKSLKIRGKIENSGSYCTIWLEEDHSLCIKADNATRRCFNYLLVCQDEVRARLITAENGDNVWGFIENEDPKQPTVSALIQRNRLLATNGRSTFYINGKKAVEASENFLLLALLEDEVLLCNANGSFGNNVFFKVFSPSDEDAELQLAIQLASTIKCGRECSTVLDDVAAFVGLPGTGGNKK